MKKRSSPIWLMPKEKLENIVKKSKTITDILKVFGLDNKGSNYRTIKRRLAEDNIDYSHIPMGSGANKNRSFPGKRRSLEEILVKNSNYHRSSLKPRLINENIIKYECAKCGLKDQWEGKKLVLVLDHINGTSNDNRISNLRLLCPNCNSQTSTFAGKKAKIVQNCIKCGIEITKHTKFGMCRTCVTTERNKKRRKVKNRPSKEKLEKLIAENSWCAIGRMYGVTDNAIRRWARTYNIL